MINPLILILNPFQSNLEEQVVEIIKKETPFRYSCLHDIIYDSKLEQDTPDLIFFLLDKCCDDVINAENFESFYSNFPLTPVIGILDSEINYRDLLVLQKFVWSILTIPFNVKDIILNIRWYLKGQEEPEQNIVSSSLKKQTLFEILKGESIVLLRIKEKILKIAPYDVSVLINGETGTGKELCAKIIHFLSKRSKNPFIPVNCGAIPKELFENELFGHKKGAYTNADSSESGLVTVADNGTLFLDEIESMAESSQVKLLRFLEEKKYKPLGQPHYVSSDVRIIVAAQKNLWDLVERKQFRRDLFYRLNVVNIYLPPLRDRKSDIPILITHFIKKYSELYNKKINGITPKARMNLLHNKWQGNVRELENVIQEAVVMNNSGWIEQEDLNYEKFKETKIVNINSFRNVKRKVVEDFEKSYLENILSLYCGNISRAARHAEQDRRAFCRLLKKYKVEASTYRTLTV